jgi:hypothetical protein
LLKELGAIFASIAMKTKYRCLLFHLKIIIVARCWWLTPVILATQEAEIRRISVQYQLRQIVHETLSQKTHHKKELVEWLKM